MADKILTRAEAKAQGLKRYLGHPCQYGHSGERYADGSCILCKLARNQRWADANPEKKAVWRSQNGEYVKAYCKRHHAGWYAENKDKKDAANKARREADPEKAREQARKGTRKWQAKNPDKAKGYAAKWYSDSENRAAHRHRRRARIRDAGGTHTAADLRTILSAQGHLCVYCRADLREVKRHLDHIKPLARGGSNDKSNLQYLCAPCNLTKAARDPV